MQVSYGRDRRHLCLLGCLSAVIFILSFSYAVFAAPYAAIVQDERTGRILYEKNADKRLHPASLTKMLTLYIVFQEVERGNIGLDDKITISQNAANQPPSRLGLKAGQKIALRYLIRAAAVKSANDAATALADAISGSQKEFARRMNRTARALGMKSSTFKNANGLTASGHLSTARDMNTLGRRLFQDFPQYYNIFSRKKTDAGIKLVRNTNRRFLDDYEGADGIKTGYTSMAGFNLTASAKRGRDRVVVTVFGGRSTTHRNNKVADLLNLGFKELAKGIYAGKESPQRRAKFATISAPPARNTVFIDKQKVTSGVDQTAEAIIASVSAAHSAEANNITDPVVNEIILQNSSSALDEILRGHKNQRAAIAPPRRPIDLIAAQQNKPKESIIAQEKRQESQQASLLYKTELSSDQKRPSESSLVPVSLVNTQAPARPPIFTNKKVSRNQRKMPALGSLQDEYTIMQASLIEESGWSVHIGHFSTRDAAERALLQIQLIENAALNNGQRNVLKDKSSYEAKLDGLTQTQAHIACRKLAVRGHQCSVGRDNYE